MQERVRSPSAELWGGFTAQLQDGTFRGSSFRSHPPSLVTPRGRLEGNVALFPRPLGSGRACLLAHPRT